MNRNRSGSSHKKLSSLLIFVILVIAGLLFVLYFMPDTLAFPRGVSSILKRVTGNYINYNEPDSPPELDDCYVMYHSLNDADKNAYCLFVDLVENRAYEGYTNAIVISNEKLIELGLSHLWYVYYAMCYDHPEYFFLLTQSSNIDCQTINNSGYAVCIFSMEISDPSESEQIAAFENATNAFFEDIDLNASDEAIELAIHDKLIDMVTYDYDIMENLLSENPTWDLGNTAYGALVSDSDGRANHAVCSGYAFAFEYLMHRAGIPCTYVTGSAVSTPPSSYDQESHAWNVIQISGKWYEVDSTWDDTEFDSPDYDDFYNAMQNDEEKFFNLRHHYFNRTTSEMQDLKAAEDTLFYLDGYAPYNAVYDTSHTRFTGDSEDFDEMDVFLNSLIPIAE